MDEVVISKLPLLFVDTETGGLDPFEDELLEVSAIRTDWKGSGDIVRENIRIMPEFPERVNPEAARINGFSVEEWRRSGALGPAEGMGWFAERAQGARLVCHKPSFDWDFLSFGARKVGIKIQLGDHHPIDTATMAHMLAQAGLLPGVRLKDLCHFFGFEQVRAHSALSDAENTRQCYVATMEMVHEALTGARSFPRGMGLTV